MTPESRPNGAPMEVHSMYAAVASVSRETEEDAIDVYQAVIDYGMQLDAEEARREEAQRLRDAEDEEDAKPRSAWFAFFEDDAWLALFHRKKHLLRVFVTLKSKTRPESAEAADARMQRSDVEVREVQSETEVTQMRVNQGHTELECTEADLEAAVGMMAAAVTQARVETKERETIAEGMAENLCNKRAEDMAEDVCNKRAEGMAENLCNKRAEDMAEDVCNKRAEDTAEDVCVNEEQRMEAMQLEAMEAAFATKAAIAQMKTEHAAMLQSLKKAIEAEVERRSSDLCDRVQELQQKLQAMQEQHEALREAQVQVAKKAGDDEEQTFNIVVANKEARAAGEGQSDNKTEVIEQKMTLDTEVMDDATGARETGLMMRLKESPSPMADAKTPLIAAADIETKKIESMKSKTIPRKLKKGDAKMIEHPKKKRKRLSMKSKTGGVCKAKHESRAVGAYREHNKVAANTHPPHPDMTATLLAMKDPVRHNLQSRGAIPARVADADVEFTNHVREDANCARETRLFKEAETEAKAKQAAASGKKDESSSPIADAETTERTMDKEGKATGTVFPGRGGKTVPG